MKKILKKFFYNLLVKGLGGKRLKGVPDNLNNLLEINQELVLVIEVEGYDSPLLITDKAQIEEVNSRLERMARWYLAFLKEDLAKNN